jgi:hypothetical protein
MSGEVKATKIACICSAPQGTLGDPSSAIKYLESIKKKYPDIDVHLVVKAAPQDIKKVEGIIPKDMPYTILYEPFEKRIHYLERMFSETDGIVIYPTPHFLSQSEYLTVKKLEKPIFNANEYDFDLKYNFSPRLAQRSSVRMGWIGLYPPIFDNYFDTGLSGTNRKSMGIFLSDEEKQSHYLSKIQEEDGLKVRNLLFGNEGGADLQQSENDYFNSHDMYFGYFNNLNSLGRKFKTTPMGFLDFSIARSKGKSEGVSSKNIDIIMPIRSDGTHANTQKMFEHIKKYDPEQYTFEYYEKKEGELKCTQKYGNGDTVVRIINGFPFQADTMAQLMRASDPFTMVTGNQSLSEAISYGKIPFYQVMTWTTRVPSSFIESIGKHLGEGSLLQEYFKSFSGENSIDIASFASQEKELVEQMEKFRKILLKEENLSENFPEMVMTLLGDEDIREQHIRNFILENRCGLSLGTPLGNIYSRDELVQNFIKYSLELHQIGFDPILWAINHDKSILKSLMAVPQLLNSNNHVHYEAYMAVEKINAEQRRNEEAGVPYFKMNYKITNGNSAKISINEGTVFDKKSDCTIFYSLSHQKDEVIKALETFGVKSTEVHFTEQADIQEEYSNTIVVNIDVHQLSPEMLSQKEKEKKSLDRRVVGSTSLFDTKHKSNNQKEDKTGLVEPEPNLPVLSPRKK